MSSPITVIHFFTFDSLIVGRGVDSPGHRQNGLTRRKVRLGAWKEAGKQKHVGSMLLGGASPEALRVIAEEVL